MNKLKLEDGRVIVGVLLKIAESRNVPKAYTDAMGISLAGRVGPRMFAFDEEMTDDEHWAFHQFITGFWAMFCLPQDKIDLAILENMSNYPSSND